MRKRTPGGPGRGFFPVLSASPEFLAVFSRTSALLLDVPAHGAMEVVHEFPATSRHRVVAESSQHEVLAVEAESLALAAEVEIGALHALVAETGDYRVAAVAIDDRKGRSGDDDFVVVVLVGFRVDVEDVHVDALVVDGPQVLVGEDRDVITVGIFPVDFVVGIAESWEEYLEFLSEEDDTSRSFIFEVETAYFRFITVLKMHFELPDRKSVV